MPSMVLPLPPPTAPRGWRGRLKAFFRGLVWLAPLLVLAASVGFSGWLMREAETRARSAFAFDVEAARKQIDERFHDHLQEVQGAVAFSEALGDRLTARAWADFVDSLQIGGGLSGAHALGFLEPVRASAGSPLRTRLAFHAKLTDLGLAGAEDMAAYPVRREALETARDRGELVLCGQVGVGSAEAGPSALLFAPVYRQGGTRDSLAGRREAFRGWVFSVLDLRGLLRSTLGPWEDRPSRPLGFRLQEPHGPRSGADLYHTSSRGDLEGRVDDLAQTRNLSLGGRPLRLTCWQPGGPAAGFGYGPAYYALGFGLLLTGLLVALSLRVRVRLGEREAAFESLSRRHATLQQASLDGIHVLDENGLLVEANDSFLKLLGYERSELLGRPVTDWEARIPPEDLPARIQALLAQPGRFETLHRRKDGRAIPVEVQAVGVTLAGRRYLYATSRDLSARRAAEADRQRLLERFEKIGHQVPGMLYQFRLRPDGTSCFPFASDAIERVYRVRPEDVVEDASRILAILHPEDTAAVVASIQASARDLAPWRCEYRVAFADGTVRWLSGDAMPEREPDGAILWHGYIHDITDRKESDARQRASDRMFNLLLQSAAEAVYGLDLDGRCTFANPACLAMLGQPDQGAVLGRDMHDITHHTRPDGRPLAREDCRICQALRRGAAVHVEDEAFWRADGTSFPVEYWAHPVLEDGAVIGAVVTFFDVSERRAAQDAAKEAERRWQFALEGPGHGVWDWDVQQGTFYRSRQWKTLLGLPADAELDSLQDWDVRIHPADRDRVYANLNRHLEGAEPVYQSEYRLRHEDGRYLWVLDQGKVLAWDERRRPLRAIGTIQDVSARKAIEHQLEENLGFINVLLETVPSSIYVKDLEGRYLRFNAAFERLFGVSREEWIGRTVLDLVEPAASAAFMHAKDLELIQTGGLQSYEAEFKNRLTGDPAVGLYWKALLRQPDGTPTAIVGTILDITDRRRIEHALARSERRLKEAFLASSDAAWEMDLVTREVGFSEHWYDMLGYQAGDVPPTAESFAALAHPADLARLLAEMRRVFKDPGRSSYAVEMRMRALSGDWKWLLLRGRVMERAPDGRALRVAGTTTDIDDRKRGERMLEEANRRLSLATLAGGVGIFDYDLVQDSLAWDAQMYRLYGVARESYPLAYDAWVASLHPEDRAGAIEAFRMALEGGREFDTEFRVVWPDGSIHTIRGLASIERDPEGHPVRMLGTNWDISAEKAAEQALRDAARELAANNEALTQARDQALQAVRARSEFLANMSHEIRTPMNGVLGLAEILGATELTLEQRDCVQRIIRSGDGLLSLLNDILDFSKMEAGQLSLDAAPFNLEHLVYDAAELFRARLEGRPVELLVDYDPACPPSVVGDPGRIRQILSNLLSNAVKFTERGHILVEVRSTLLAGSRMQVSLQVKDSGVGIPLEQQARLFQPFVQADSSTARRYGGTGLGLVMVKRLAEAMGGEVHLASAPGVGTAFTVEVELDLGEAEAQADLAGLRGRRVLLVDDLRSQLLLLARQLEYQGLETQPAASAEEALRLLVQAHHRGAPFDAAVVDLQMPGGADGLELGRQIRADGRFGSLALLALTASGVRGDAGRLAELGFDAYLVKPLPQELLCRAIAQALQRTGQPRSAPLVTRHSLAESGPAQEERTALPPGACVLLVEDQDTNQVVARKFLEGAGARVVVASHGAEALQYLASASFDLVLMDCQMPVMDGFEATARIRSQEQGTGRHVPIIAMTAHAMAGDRERCLASGMDDYLTKPIRQEALLRAVAQWLPGSAGPARPDLPVPAAAGLCVDRRDPRLGLDGALYDRLVEVFGGGPGGFREAILDPFLAMTEARLAGLQEAARSGDAEDLANQAHALKGSALTIGFGALGRAAERLEHRAPEASAAERSALVQEVASALAAARAFLQEDPA